MTATLLYAGIAAAQSYEVESAYLKVPRRNLERLTELADFFVGAKDDVHGGFYTFVNRAGTPVHPPYSWWNQQWPCGDDFNYHLKSVAAHARLAHLYARAFMISGRTDYLAHARHALDFMYEHGWDEAREGWWFTTNEQGEVAAWIPCHWWDPNDWKWTYAQIYPLVGIGAFVEATRSEFDLGWLRLGMHVLDARVWDARPGLQGYYTDADLDWTNPRGKGFTPSVDGITTHALTAHLLTEESALTNRLLALADGIMQHLIPSMDQPEVAFGFAEQFDSNWNIDHTNTSGSIGHVLKAAWVLDRAYQVSARPAYLEGAWRLIREVLDNGGYDFTNGGPFQTYDWSTGEIVQNKNYWELEQAVTAGLLHHSVAGSLAERDAALRMADESLAFFHQHLWDTQYGGHYYTTNAAGDALVDASKSDVFEQGYHVSEMLYFAYVYGTLYLKQAPIQLHYAIEAADHERAIRLNPVALTSARLRILNVRRDNRPYTHFDAATRTLHVPAGVGGTFRVTFKLDGSATPG